jgi:adenylosuccinate synthase
VLVADRAHIVIDLGFGDQGKGSLTDYLVREASPRGSVAVVRYNGGAQAAHNVVTPDGRHHTFAQVGSGAFVAGAKTVLSRFVAVQPWALQVELNHLEGKGVADAGDRLLIAEEAPVITPFHRAANRLREWQRGGAAHGSCGIGFGETVADAGSLSGDDVLRAGDLRDREATTRKLARIQERKRELLRDVARAASEAGALTEELQDLSDPRMAAVWSSAVEPVAPLRIVSEDELAAEVRGTETLIFEGAQGVLLDEWRGFHPHTTWSDCTGRNATSLLAEWAPDAEVERLGVLRAYATRHGAGPLPTEDLCLTAALPESHNDHSGFQGRFRVGCFDAVLARYALGCIDGVDAIALTCLDRVVGPGRWRYADSYLLGASGRPGAQPQGPPPVV